jgi:diguanylate cyclase (GGDEF)-like protein
VTPPLAVWEGSQQAQLKALTSASEQTLLLRLLEASCVAEFAKLTAARLDLPTWAQTALDVLGQFLPLVGARLHVAPGGLPELTVAFGDGRDAAAGAMQSHILVLDGEPAGTLDVVPSAGLPADSELFATVADHLSLSLAAVAETERLRRQAAAATALSLAATIDEPCQESHLQALVGALGALPGAAGARLTLESILLGGSYDVRSGILDGSALGEQETVTAGGSRLHLEVAWSNGAAARDHRGLDDVVAVVMASLERAERSQRLRQEVETDPLTGVGNRRRASAALRAAFGRAERLGEDVSVLAFDLDHFKRVNDVLGHDVGDKVLVAFATFLLEQVRVYDTVARTGGEEFIIVCPGTDAFGARTLAERLRSKVSAACAEALPEGWNQTTSIGIAVYPEAATSIDAILRKADEALYDAKRGGRDQIAMCGRGPKH